MVRFVFLHKEKEYKDMKTQIRIGVFETNSSSMHSLCVMKNEGKYTLQEITHDLSLIHILWDTYLDSFAPGTNNIFRERREHDCTCCRQFIRTIGAVVVVKNNKMESIWDVDMSGTIYDPVVKALSKLIHNEEVVDVFVSQLKNIGTDKNLSLIHISVVCCNLSGMYSRRYLRSCHVI